MIRTTPALAATATAFALLLTGCGDDSTDSSTAASSSATAAASSLAQVVDSTKAGTFVVSYKSAFPALAQGRTDVQISEILSKTCTDIKAGKSEDAAVATVISATKNGDKQASKEEAQAIYQMARLMCG
ncbi:hypothetical protein ACWEKT_15210 [Nocardia takedensis]